MGLGKLSFKRAYLWAVRAEIRPLDLSVFVGERSFMDVDRQLCKNCLLPLSSYSFKIRHCISMRGSVRPSVSLSVNNPCMKTTKMFISIVIPSSC